MAARHVVGGVAGLVVVAVLAAWALGMFVDPAAKAQAAEDAARLAAPPALQVQAVAQVARQVPQSQADVQLSFAPVVKEVTPAVVNVYATKIEQGRTSPFAGDPFFSRFFGGDLRPQSSQSLGSGVIVDPSGIIVTNSHVVNGADEIHIALSGGREYQVDVLLDDPKSDLAVLKIKDPKGKTFPSLTFADSDGLEVGDLVLAVGNPFGVGQTVTSGIVSALARSGVETENFDYFIQTDAAINPGNSGGALVDLNGNLVGINTAIFTRSGGSVGIGFAIPANMARTVAEAAEKGGKIVRPWFGARLQEVTTDIADSLGIDPPHGALIAEIASGSPADKAGLKAGDVIVDIDGIAIDAPQGFDFRFATKELGTKSQLTYVRSGQQANASIDIAAAPAADDTETAVISDRSLFDGITISNLTAPLAQDMDLPFDAKGVVVTDVKDGTYADQIGLRAHDLIESLDGQTVDSVATFKSLVSKLKRGWQIVIQRNGQTIQSYISG